MFKCFKSSQNQGQVSNRNGQPIKITQSTQAVHSNFGQKGPIITRFNLQIPNAKFDSLIFDLNKNWSQNCHHLRKDELKKQMKDKIFQKIQCLPQLVDFLVIYIHTIEILIQRQYFGVHLWIFHILTMKNKENFSPKEDLSDIKIQHLIKQKHIDYVSQRNLPFILQNIQDILNNLHQIYGGTHYQQMLQQNPLILSKLINKTSQILHQDTRLSQKQAQNMRQVLKKQIQQFMRIQLLNQYLLDLQLIMTTIEWTKGKKIQRYLNIFFERILVNKNKIGIQILVRQVEYFHQFCIGNAKMLEDKEQEKQSPKKKVDQNSQQSKKESQISQDKSESEPNRQSIQTKNSEKPQGDSYKYIKFYQSQIVMNLTYCIIKKYLKYVSFYQLEEKQIVLQALFAQNEMNIVRHLSDKNCQFLLKVKTKFDSNPEEQDMIKYSQTPIIEKRRLVFEYESLKGDRCFSKINCNGQKQIFTKHIWQYNSRKLVYSFLYYFANTIQQLERLNLHQLDFSLQNFIKFGNKFFMVDLEHVYIVRQKPQTRHCTEVNKQIFRLWLNNMFNDRLAHILHDSNYKQIKNSYREYLNKPNNDTSQGRNYAIQCCLKQMPRHMKTSHFNQFSKIVKELFGINQQNVMIPDEIKCIKQILNNQDYGHFYKTFICQLKKIYIYFNNPSMKKYDILGQQSYLLSDLLVDFQDKQYLQIFRKKSIFLTEYFDYSYQSKYICNLIKFSQVNDGDIILSCEDDNSEALLKKIASKDRYVFNFIVKFLETLQQMEKRGFLMVNIGINTFAQVGELFKWKKFIYVFKLQPDHPKEASYTSGQLFYIDKLLVSNSVELLYRLLIEQNSDIRSKVFHPPLLSKIRKALFGLENPQAVINGSKKKHSQKKSGPIIENNRSIVLELLKQQARAIHVQQVKMISEQIFQLFQAKHDDAIVIKDNNEHEQTYHNKSVLITARELIRTEQPHNFYQIRKVLQKRSSEVILASYK